MSVAFMCRQLGGSRSDFMKKPYYGLLTFDEVDQLIEAAEPQDVALLTTSPKTESYGKGNSPGFSGRPSTSCAPSSTSNGPSGAASKARPRAAAPGRWTSRTPSWTH
ncbi:hypothetical protein LZ198_23715 [Myxococcus sp. K15C18031901]|uniref:hypothetical protein n=1 Tax=Myxococcus dinghuensis TaxID=2906761 RepID=UPI0020A79EB2|nr:hypothetical protein [Myxococcus dinghuensis]MCP3101889.1 hypothetical protein [Myxococcus dinghuensis]